MEHIACMFGCQLVFCDHQHVVISRASLELEHFCLTCRPFTATNLTSKQECEDTAKDRARRHPLVFPNTAFLDPKLELQRGNSPQGMVLDCKDLCNFHDHQAPQSIVGTPNQRFSPVLFHLMTSQFCFGNLIESTPWCESFPCTSCHCTSEKVPKVNCPMFLSIFLKSLVSVSK